jgi:hypothetical protein
LPSSAGSSIWSCVVAAANPHLGSKKTGGGG